MPKKFVRGYIEPLPCRCPVRNMYIIIDDGRDRVYNLNFLLLKLIAPLPPPCSENL